MLNKGLFSSNTEMWATPIELFKKINDEFNFDLDVCASPENHKCEKYFSKETNGLEQDWIGTCWMNPPYGKEIYTWMKKAYQEYKKHGSTIVCLVPARTDTKWWHDFATKGGIRFFKGRLKFNDCFGSAPFPSALIIFSNNERHQKTIFIDKNLNEIVQIDGEKK